MIAAAHIDEPEENATVQRHGFGVSGWVVPEPDRQVISVVVTAENLTLGLTQRLYARPDVDNELELSARQSLGFSLDCVLPPELRGHPSLSMIVEAVDDAGDRAFIGGRSLQFSVHDYRAALHGYLFEPGFDVVVRREQIYASGPASAVASGMCANLIFRYLDAGSRVLDVGCGIGAYGRVFREQGRAWTGCEVRPEYVAAARADGLDVHLVDAKQLPFADASFDAAIAIEVIEHIDDLHGFLSEVQRVAPRMALISVPNFEVIPITATYYAVPWHMLEPDHRNFFSHASLAAVLRLHYANVEVVEYGKLPLLHALDGLALNNHLFAVAWGAL